MILCSIKYYVNNSTKINERTIVLNLTGIDEESLIFNTYIYI